MPSDDDIGVIKYLPTGRGYLQIVSERLLALSQQAEELSASATHAMAGPTLSEYSEMETLIQSISDHLTMSKVISETWRRTSGLKGNC
jgi:hypothetical protein